MHAGHVLGEGGVEEHLAAVVAAAGAHLLQLVREHLLLALLHSVLLGHLLVYTGLAHRLLRLAVGHKGRVARLW